MIRTILVALFLLLFWIASLFMFAYVNLIGRKNPRKKAEVSQKIVRGAFKIIACISGLKIEADGIENVPTDEPVLYVSNHRSDFDAVVGYITVPTTAGFVAKKQIEKVPCVSRWMRYMNCIFIDRENIKEGLKSIIQGIDNVKAGYSMFIMPEGTRNHEKEMLPFKKGSFKIAEKSGCPIVPVAISNADLAFEAQIPRIKSTVVKVSYGKPIRLSELTKEQQKTINDDVRNVIHEMLDKHNEKA